MQRIKFTHSGHCHALGNFAAGDIATVSAELAAHFVKDARCAQYLQPAAPAPQPAAPEPAKAEAPRRAAKKAP